MSWSISPLHVKLPYGVKRLRLCFPQAISSRKLLRDSCSHYLYGYHAVSSPSRNRRSLRLSPFPQTFDKTLQLPSLSPVDTSEMDVLVHGRANATVIRYLAMLSYAFTMAMRV